ncbi:MAG TPA: VOC family protein [Myxococcaceae bacterium]|nr:VOC family protein [Myxococcaceae bacterium]
MRVLAQPLIAVADVVRSSQWYSKLLGLKSSSIEQASDHAHLYDRLLDNGALVLQLHAWDEENHPNLVGSDDARHGHGVLLWFEVDDFDAAVARARELGAEVLEDVHANPAPGHWELWLRDPDGYVVVIASPDGSVPR